MAPSFAYHAAHTSFSGLALDNPFCIFYTGNMKVAANIKLCPSPEQFALLEHTLRVANEACNQISKTAWEHKKFRQFDLHHIVYHETKKRFGLGAQIVLRCTAKVANAYKTNRKTQCCFRKYAAQPFDKRIFRLMSDGRVSIWTTEGRQKIPFICGDYQRKLLEQVTESEVDLMFIRGSFYIAAICDIDEETMINPEDVLGIDLGIVNIAVDSEGNTYSGEQIEKHRRKNARLRNKLQKKGTKSAKRKLKKISGKQTRFQKDTNHCVSKAIVAEAKRLSCAVALENLKGIRKRIKARKSERARLNNWAFCQLRTFIEYKAKLKGIPVIEIDPRYTSQECPECHHIEKSNRKTRDLFVCKSCGFSQPSDFTAARNIRARAVVNLPIAEVSFM